MWILLRLKTALKGVILPPTGPMLLAILGACLIGRLPRLARVFLAIGLGSLWLMSTPLVSDALTGLVEIYPPLDLSSAAGAQAIVILGGGGQRGVAPEYGAPAAEPLLLERLSYGAYVAHKTGLPVLVTGYRIEAVAMRDTLRRNFAVDARWVDDESHDTFENARNSVRLLAAAGVSRIVLVTRATHLPRSVQEFIAAGIQVVPAPVGMLARRELGIYRFVPNPEAAQRTYLAVYELLGEPLRVFLSVTHLRRH